MAAQPVLHLFPSVAHAEKRRDELDELIKKSMELRPSRPFARPGMGGATKRVASRSRSRAPAVQALATQAPSTNAPIRTNAVATVSATLTSSGLASLTTRAMGTAEHVRTQSMERQNSKEYMPPPQATRYQQQQPLPIRTVHSEQQLLVNSHPRKASPVQQSYHPPPLSQPTTTPLQSAPAVNPAAVKSGPLPPPPIDTANFKRMISRTPPRARPRRSSSARGHGRVSNSSIATRASTTISPVSSIQSLYYSGITSTAESPVTNPSVYGSRPSSNIKHEQQVSHFTQERRRSEHNLPSPSIYSSKSDECLLLPAVSLPPPPPPPRHSLRAYTAPVASHTSSPPRQTLSRASHRQQESNASNLSWRGRQSTQDSLYQSPVSMSRCSTALEMHSPESYYMPEKPILSSTMDESIQSMFPVYNHTLPLQAQSYQPQRSAPVPPTSRTKHESASSGSRASSNVSSVFANGAQQISSLEELNSLWTAANGQITTQLPGAFNLRMFKQGETKRRSKIIFGPSETQAFYSLAQAHPAENEDDEAHEALIFRHHASKEEKNPDMSKDDLLPISHMLIYPPPAPSSSRTSRHSDDKNAPEEANPISTVTPVMATLHALETAAKSPQAHALASSDPKAESPAAARLAERAVRAATERESCTLGWVRTCPRSGKYELHHPSLGVFTVAVEGDVKAALSSISSSTKARKHASITLLNPFASLTYQSPPIGPLSPTAASFRDSVQAPAQAKPLGTLVKLDFSDELLHIDAPAIQSLGNVYLLDVAVATVLAVAIAESQRAADPGLLFAAPPPSLMLTKSRKSTRLFSSYSSSSASTTCAAAALADSSANDKKKKKLTSASTVSLVQLVRGTSSSANTTTTTAGKKDSNSNSSSSSSRRTIDWSRTNAILGIEHLTDVQDLPRITRGILSVLGLGFKTALWLLEFGVRISAKMVIGLTRFADKS